LSKNVKVLLATPLLLPAVVPVIHRSKKAGTAVPGLSLTAITIFDFL